MSAIQMPIEEAKWSVQVRHGSAWKMSDSRRKSLLPMLMGWCAVIVDALLLASAFLLAYAARFSVDETLAMLSFDRYVRLATLEAAFATILLAAHGLYELERPQSWAVRLRGIVSSSATALVLAVTV